MIIDKLVKLLKNTQVIAYVVVGLILITTMLLLFTTSPKDDWSIVNQEISILADNIRNHYKTKPDYWGLNSQSAAKFSPKEMVRNDKIVSAIGREFIIGQNEVGNTVMPSQRNFMISINNLSKNACRQIAQFDIDDKNQYGLQKIIINTPTVKTEFEWGGKNSLPISSENANKFCDKKNTISWVFE